MRPSNRRPYAERFNHVMGKLAASVGDKVKARRNCCAAPEAIRPSFLVVMTAERGLCGGFNGNIAKLARAEARKAESSGQDGEDHHRGQEGPGCDQARSMAISSSTMWTCPSVKNVGYADAQKIAAGILDRFEAGEFDVAKIFYSKFQNVVSQVPTMQQVIPFDVPEGAGDDAPAASTITSRTKAAILAQLLPRAVATAIFSGLLENGASEQGARMSAMDNATRNAGEMIDKLTIEFNRSRQAVITNELIEIISGAEAL